MLTATAAEANNVIWQRKVEELFLDHYQFMYRTAKGVIGHSEDAEDVVQNLFLKLVQHEPRQEFRKNPKGYLHRAVVNEALNMIRSHRRRSETDGVEELEIPEPGSGRSNDNIRNTLLDTFSNLKPHVVEILILHYEHGYSDADIAELLGQSRSKIASILSRTRAQLRKTVGRNHDAT